MVMGDEQSNVENNQPFLSDLNTRLIDIDERSRLIRERVLLLGKNLLSSRQEIEDELKEIREENKIIKSDIEKIKKLTSGLLNEFSKFTKRDEMYLIERMLKDFQPLEFMRKKDVEELIDERIKNKKQIKTEKADI
jgi:signal transduction histidine kinase